MIAAESAEIVENNKNVESEINEIVETNNNGVQKEQVNEEEEKMDVDAVAVRRQSQNSENNGNDGTDNVTPVQTDDNDEVKKLRIRFLSFLFAVI